MPNPENVIKHGFKSKPENINRTGLNRKSFATINLDLEAKGIKPLSKHDLIDAYGRIFNSTEDELKVLSTDKTVPYAFRLLILQLNDKKVRDLALKDYREFMFGKAQQQTDITSKGESISKKTDLSKLTEIELRNYIELEKKVSE